METTRRRLLRAAASVGVAAQLKAAPANSGDRAYWLALLERLAAPVLEHLSRGTLKSSMPVECSGTHDRRPYTHLEAFARLLAGIAPWLEAPLEPGPERDLQQHYAGLARGALAMATDPASPDFLNFSEGVQPLVDCGFLAEALLRAPGELWRKLDAGVQRRVAAALASSRVIVPGFNNWLLFSAMVETALAMMGERWDGVRIDYAVRQLEEWYLGDGIYGDGPHFHWDYYNSFVIQPMLLDVLQNIAAHSRRWESRIADVRTRARRYAAIEEHLIGPDGSYPAIGRSITYRCGAFHLLAQVAAARELPAPLTGPQVRCAMTAMMRRVMDAPGTFDREGWLQIGLCGHQPHLGESYISTGSLYLCSVALLPLALPASDAFWSGAAEEWTSRRIAAGRDVAADHAV